MGKSEVYVENHSKVARCPICGKVFNVEYPELYVYKIRSGSNYKYYCCWTHYLKASDNNKKRETHYLTGLKGILYKRGLNLKECAKICQKSPMTIYRYAELENRATMPVINRIAKSLGVQPEELYKDDKK